ncbi:MAG: tetratricopeptide repeat protein [Prevotella sp.]|nr:tetratricopeptide repeat protein [Prevotella sp.]
MAETKVNQGAPQVEVTPSGSEALLLKYKNIIIGAVIALLVIVAGYFFWKNTANQSFAKASTAMAKAQEYYSQAVMSDDAALFEKALNGDSINAGFLAIASDYSGKAANLANLYAGICYSRLGNNEEAAKYLDKFSGVDDEMVTPAVKGALANAKASLGQLDEAVSLLTKAAAEADNSALSPMFLIQAGDILESQGKKAEALKLYEQIKEKYQDWTRYNSIDNYIERAKQ